MGNLWVYICRLVREMGYCIADCTEMYVCKYVHTYVHRVQVIITILSDKGGITYGWTERKIKC